jgi:hypothetical protein
MTNTFKVEAKYIVENFLMDYPNPNTKDWSTLIDTHPEFAQEIADAAIFHGSFNDTNTNEDVAFDQKAYDATISQVLNHVYQTPSPSVLEANQKIEAIKGPQIKIISITIGIGPYPVLLNGILAGRILAPNSVLNSLSNFLKVPILALQQVFQSKFEQSVIPSFKSTESKPEVKTNSKSWEAAVRSLELSADETVRLLKLSDED